MIDGKVGELELADEHGGHLDKAEPGSVEERVFFFFRLVNVGAVGVGVVLERLNNLVLLFHMGLECLTCHKVLPCAK